MSRSTPRPGRRNTTEAYRREREQKCVEYLLKAGTLPAARKLAARDGFGAQTSAWLGALGKILKGGTR